MNINRDASTKYDDLTVDVVIEQSKMSSAIYRYNRTLQMLECCQMTPFASECNCGVIPNTTNYRCDNSPLQVIVVSSQWGGDEPILAGTVVQCRILGMLESRIVEDEKIYSTLIVCPSTAVFPFFNNVKDICDIDKDFLQSIKYNIVYKFPNHCAYFSEFVGHDDATDLYIRALNWELD